MIWFFYCDSFTLQVTFQRDFTTLAVAMLRRVTLPSPTLRVTNKHIKLRWRNLGQWATQLEIPLLSAPSLRNPSLTYRLMLNSTPYLPSICPMTILRNTTCLVTLDLYPRLASISDRATPSSLAMHCKSMLLRRRGWSRAGMNLWGCSDQSRRWRVSLRFIVKTLDWYLTTQVTYQVCSQNISLVPSQAYS